MMFESNDPYTQEVIVDLVGVGKYGKSVSNHIKCKDITGLDCKESISDTHDFDLTFVIASLEELENISEEEYRPPKNLKSYETISYLYVKTNNCIDFCNSEQFTELQDHFDVIIPIPNNPADEQSIYWSIRGITELLTIPSLIGIDFADVSYVTKSMGIGATAFGCASGKDRFVTAAEQALSTLSSNDIDVRHVKGMLVSISAGMDITPSDFDEIGTIVRNASSRDTHVLNGILGGFSNGKEIYVVITAIGVC